jgi:hypothetical protein
MHCELVVPGLLSSDAGARLPALETLLGRGRLRETESRTLERWLLDSFGLEEESLAAGALTVLAHGAQAGDSVWARADPIHLRLMRDRVLVVPSAAFTISPEEADALCETLNRHFAGQLEFHAPAPEHWCVRLAAEMELPIVSPLEIAGRPMEPVRGGDTLLNELQMLLHEHPVNEAREGRGELAVNSLWLWGAGRAPRVGKPPWRSVSSDEPISLGLARAAAIRSRALAASGTAWLERGPDEGRHLVVLDSLRPPLALSDAAAPSPEYRGSLEQLEQSWFGPLLAALRAGRIGMLTIHAPDAAEGTSVETIRGDLRRFWRRARPLAAWVR